MAVETLEVGDLAVCCYLVNGAEGDGGASPCVVVDPGAEAGRIHRRLQERNLTLHSIFLTHAHADHIGGVDALLQAWPEAALVCSAETSRRASDPVLNLSVHLGPPISCRQAHLFVTDGQRFEAAGMKWQAVEIPGHEPGEMVYILGDSEAVFTGDTVFSGSIGRSDFPGGDGRALIAGVRSLLASLPQDTPLYPGHGPATTVKQELQYNPFLQ